MGPKLVNVKNTAKQIKEATLYNQPMWEGRGSYFGMMVYDPEKAVWHQLGERIKLDLIDKGIVDWSDE